MVSILDNKKVAELVIEAGGQDYEKINPESLATVISESHDEEPGVITPTVQAHIDDTSIHFTMADVDRETSKYLEASDFVEGSNIDLSYDEETHKLTIATEQLPLDEFMTVDSLIPYDTTITITPKEESTNQAYIRANIPDTSHFLVPFNIKASDPSITVSNDIHSNNVYLKANFTPYEAGDGISISNNRINNTAKDKEVVIRGGTNITVQGAYPNFTIDAEDKIRLQDWEANVGYKRGECVMYHDGVWVCIANASTPEAFIESEWELVAKYELFRKVITTTSAINSINLQGYGLMTEIPSKDNIFININGTMLLSSEYSLDPDGVTVRFPSALASGTTLDITVLSSSIVKTHDESANLDEWESNISYKVGNIVIYGGCLYKCITAHISGNDFDPTKWEILSGYKKESYYFTTTEPTTSITLPEGVYTSTDMTVNVGNTMLLSNAYTLSNGNRTITFVDPIEAGRDIEVIVYGHAVIQHPMVPEPSSQGLYLTSNDVGGYETISLNNLIDRMGFETLTFKAGNNNALIGINEDGSDYKFYSQSDLAQLTQARTTANGLTATNTGNDVTIDTGSVLSKDRTVMLQLRNAMTKDFSQSWARGDGNGGILGYGDGEWQQPNTSIDIEARLRVHASSEQNDREGWRAMDAFDETGTGWLSLNGVTNATWEYVSEHPIKVSSITFVQNTAGTSYPLAKNIDVWVSDDDQETPELQDKIIVGSFVAPEVSLGRITYDIPTPRYARVFGLTIRDSYGAGVGSKHIEMIGTQPVILEKSAKGYIYIISDDEVSKTDIAGSYYTGADFEALLPEGYTQYTLIGTFETNDESNISRVTPRLDIAEAYAKHEIATIDDLNYYVDELLEIAEAFEGNTLATTDDLNAATTELSNEISSSAATVTQEYTTAIANAKTEVEGEITSAVSSLEGQISAIFGKIYPVGSLYFGEMNTCPMAALITGSTWKKVSSGRVIQGSDSNHAAGTTIEPGLPNITGSIAVPRGVNSLPTPSGAFTKRSNTWNARVGSGANDDWGNYYDFNASKSSSIYGNSTTVQPPAYVVNIWKRTA